MSTVLFDPASRESLHPLNQLKAIADLRMGLLTIKERWGLLLDKEMLVSTVDYLKPLYAPLTEGEHLWINAAVIPTPALVVAIKGLKQQEVLMYEGVVIAANGFLTCNLVDWPAFSAIPFTDGLKVIKYPWQLFQWNAELIRSDFELVTSGKQSQPAPEGCTLINPGQVFIEEGAVLEHCIINASEGPVYIGPGTLVMDGAIIRGPFAAAEKAVIKMGAKIYGATTIGPSCTAGGEIKNVILQGYANKAHDGYLGDSVIGEWCNIGGGASNSNIKNTASAVMMRDEATGEQVSAGLKCGLIMGDHSRIAINSAINTGTVIGTCCNVFGAGLGSKYYPAFTWGRDEHYELKGALRDVGNWMAFKSKVLSATETSVLAYIYQLPV